MRTAVPTAAGGEEVLAAWKTHDAVGLTRLLFSSLVAPRASSYAASEGSPVRGGTGWTTPYHRRYPGFARRAGAVPLRPFGRAAHASSSTQLMSLRSSLPVVSSRCSESCFLYSLYFFRPPWYSSIQLRAKVPSWISARTFFISALVASVMLRGPVT